MYDNVYPYHEPYGKGLGVMPGRVVWSHAPKSVDWDGKGYWWQIKNFDEELIQNMMDNGIAALAGKNSAKEGWDELFTDFNIKNKRKSAGYSNNEKIAIKVNINGSAVYDNSTSGRTNMGYTNPVLLKTLLISLVKEAGIKPQNIIVFDVSRLFPEYMVEMCTEGILSGVSFVDRNTGVKDKKAPIKWSQKINGETNYLPTCVTESEYLINFADLKGHCYGITLTAKNHFGSFMNSSIDRAPVAANLHTPLSRRKMGVYSPLTDLTVNYQFFGKTMLYMLDAIICAVSEEIDIDLQSTKWKQEPFKGHFPASIFLSQDPVAIDSVGADFLINEPAIVDNNYALRNNPTVENYLHELGLIADAPSKTTYYDGNGNKIENAGVHEHWNNSKEKLYSRNLGKSEGIELYKINIK